MRNKDSVELFIKKIPLNDEAKQQVLDWKEIEDLNEATIAYQNGRFKDNLPPLCKKCRPPKQHTDACIIAYLEKHPIVDYFAGIPLVISMVAPFAVYKSLTDIFHYLADKDSNDFNSGL